MALSITKTILSRWAVRGTAVASNSLMRRHQSSDRNSGSVTTPSTSAFDEKLLEILVCPLSKKDLRYDKEKNELVCDELGVAYPIVNGIPNLIPEDARMLKEGAESPSPTS